MTSNGDRDASNAIVQLVGFYAGALARAHQQAEQYEQAIAQLRACMKARDDELQDVRIDRNNKHAAMTEMQSVIDQLTDELDKERNALKLERDRVRQLNREKSELSEKFKQLQIDNERLQRVNIESHNERNSLRDAMQRSAEALGWLKSEANQFVSQLRNELSIGEFRVETPRDVLSAVTRLVSWWNKTNKTSTVDDESTKTLPEK